MRDGARARIRTAIRASGMTTTLDVDSVIERLLSVRGQPNNRTVQLAEGEIRALCAAARCGDEGDRTGAEIAGGRSRAGAGDATRRRAREGWNRMEENVWDVSRGRGWGAGAREGRGRDGGRGGGRAQSPRGG